MKGLKGATGFCLISFYELTLDFLSKSLLLFCFEI